MGDIQSYLHAYRDAKVLVTGGAGAIGSNLCHALAELGAAVIVLDDLSSSGLGNVCNLPNCTFIQGSILDQAVLDRAFALQPRIVFHLAALFANQNSIDHPERDLMVNGAGTLKLLQSARSVNIDRLVYASTSCSVYGAASPMPIKEDFVSVELTTPYQITKLLGELYCNFFKNSYQLKIGKVRFFNSYGPGEIPGRYRNVIPNFIYRGLHRQPLTITGTGEETRDWTYVGDIVAGLLRVGVMEEAVGEVFNLASGKETRVIDLATWVNEITENPAGIAHVGRRNWDIHDRRWASIEKAKRLLDYEPKTDLYGGLLKTVRWFKENWVSILPNVRF